MFLIIDLLSFTVLNMFPEVFPEFLIPYLGPEALGLLIIGGFITATATSAVLLFLSYKEIKTIMGKPLEVKAVYPRVEKVGIVGKTKENIV